MLQNPKPEKPPRPERPLELVESVLEEELLAEEPEDETPACWMMNCAPSDMSLPVV